MTCRNKKIFVERQSAFTLIEIIIVIALIAGVYSIALPNLGIQTQTQIADSLARLSSDVRAAFDLTVLNAKPHRLVFDLVSGEYWLESTDSDHFYMGDQKSEKDLTQEQQEEEQVLFDEKFKEYEDLAGETFTDPLSEDEILPVSPLLRAKEKLMPIKWNKVVSLEWQGRQLTDLLIITSIQAEHHMEPVVLESVEEDNRAYIYLLPSGYIEKALIHIHYRKDEVEIDQDQKPYSVITKAYRGTVEILNGLVEYDSDEMNQIE